jgi:amino acid transporter
VCILFFSLVLIFNGFTVFIGEFAVSDFFAAYVTLPLILLCFIGFKLVRKTKGVHTEDIDLGGGPAEALRGTQYDRLEYAAPVGHQSSSSAGEKV